MLSSTKTRLGLPNPNDMMPPPQIANGRDGQSLNDVSKVNVQSQSGVSPSVLVIRPTIASAALEGQLSSGFHPSALAS